MKISKSLQWNGGPEKVFKCQSIEIFDNCAHLTELTPTGSEMSVQMKSRGLKKTQKSFELLKLKTDSDIYKHKQKEAQRPRTVPKLSNDSLNETFVQNLPTNKESKDSLAKEETRTKYRKLSQQKITQSLVDESKPSSAKSSNNLNHHSAKKSQYSEIELFNSKKYLRMKHEIEIKNYLLDKMNRELATKTSKGRPSLELWRLEQEILKEINILHNMIYFAICLQRNNRAEKWGPIPISPVSSQLIKERPKSAPSKHKKLVLPKTPSGISRVSGFENLEDVILQGERKHCFNHVKLDTKGQKISERNKEVEELEHQLSHLRENYQRLQSKMNKASRPLTYS